MLRSELPFKISFASSPYDLVEGMLKNFVTTQAGIDVSPPRYEKKMDINSTSIRLYLKRLNLENKFTTSRRRNFQGSIGMLYIFEKSNLHSFNAVKSDYDIFEQLYKTVEIEPTFLEVGINQDLVVENQILEELEHLNLSLHELKLMNKSTFTEYLRSFIARSKSFQSTTQGSCDINLE